MNYSAKIDLAQLANMTAQQALQSLKKSILDFLDHSFETNYGMQAVEFAFLPATSKEEITCLASVVNPKDKSKRVELTIDSALTAIFAAVSLQNEDAFKHTYLVYNNYASKLELKELIFKHTVVKALFLKWEAEAEILKMQKLYEKRQKQLLRTIWWENNISFAVEESSSFIETCTKEKLVQIIGVSLIISDEDSESKKAMLEFFEKDNVKEAIQKSFPAASFTKLSNKHWLLDTKSLLQYDFMTLQKMENFFKDLQLFLEDFDAWCLSTAPNNEARRKRALWIKKELLGQFGAAPKTLTPSASSLEAAAFVKENLTKITSEELVEAFDLMSSAEIVNLVRLPTDPKQRDKLLHALKASCFKVSEK